MNDIFSLEGKKAVVIGGGGGIGQAIAKGLAFYGAEVVIASRNAETLANAAAEIKEEIGKDIHCITVDAGSEASIIELAKKSVELMGTVDILVNSQGYNKKYPITEIPEAEWDGMFNVNVKGVMLACREFAKIMIEKKAGRIINVGSIRGIRAVKGGGGNTCYSTTKGAVEMLTKSLATEFAPFGITVNAIGPVITDSAMMAPIFAANPNLKPMLLANIPMGRIGLPEDNMGPAVFLASEAGAFVTGTTIYPDGGSACMI